MQIVVTDQGRWEPRPGHVVVTTPRHPSEKAEKAPRGETRPPVPKWEPDPSTISDNELNRTDIKEARHTLHRGNY